MVQRGAWPAVAGSRRNGRLNEAYLWSLRWRLPTRDRVRLAYHGFRDGKRATPPVDGLWTSQHVQQLHHDLDQTHARQLGRVMVGLARDRGQRDQLMGKLRTAHLAAEHARRQRDSLVERGPDTRTRPGEDLMADPVAIERRRRREHDRALVTAQTSLDAATSAVQHLADALAANQARTDRRKLRGAYFAAAERDFTQLKVAVYLRAVARRACRRHPDAHTWSAATAPLPTWVAEFGDVLDARPESIGSVQDAGSVQ